MHTEGPTNYRLTIDVDADNLVALSQNVTFKVVPPQEPPRWVASIGAWEDSIQWDHKANRYRIDNGIVGPFETKAEAIGWLRDNSLSLGTDEEHLKHQCQCDTKERHVLPDSEYEQYVYRIDSPDQWLKIQIGDQPGEFSPEGAVDLIGDILKNREEEQ